VTCSSEKDLELVLLLSSGGQFLQGVALRTLSVALVVALTSYGSIFFGLAASLAILGEHLTAQDVIAGAFLVAALGLLSCGALVQKCLFIRNFLRAFNSKY
jgi:drug/metabolite transporter (DMT)-like permease